MKILRTAVSGHLMGELSMLPLCEVRSQLQKAHDFLVECCVAAALPAPGPLWGIEAKRGAVNLGPADARPALIGKSSERLVECINMVATVERLIAVLSWFEHEWDEVIVLLCHPTTSTSAGSNDLVLAGGGRRRWSRPPTSPALPPVRTVKSRIASLASDARTGCPPTVFAGS